MRVADWWRWPGWLALVFVLGGCPDPKQIAGAINEMSREFQADYETILAQKGTRSFKESRGAAFEATRRALAGLGTTIETEDRTLGYVNVVAPAPQPLDAEEWRMAAERDLPRMREIARRHVGPVGEFLRFEPEGLQIVITATVLNAAGGSEISLTMRMREIAPPKSGMPRREYAPPTAVRLGLDKIWAAIERELKAVR
jgi:hypothetical protein